MKDWIVRALKTFVQAFFGVYIPAVCALLSGGWALRRNQRGLESRARAGGGGAQWIAPSSLPC